MVVIDVEIAARLYREVEETMAREAVKHVVEEWHPGINLATACAVDSKSNGNLSFAGIAADFRESRHRRILLVGRDWILSGGYAVGVFVIFHSFRLGFVGKRAPILCF